MSGRTALVTGGTGCIGRKICETLAEAGYKVLIYALAVCIIGGLGSWAGAVLAAFVLGFAMKISTALFGAMWESVVLVGTIIAILLFRPSGLLGRQKELEERV